MCPHCTSNRCQPAYLVDNTPTCTWSEPWRHECEARAVLALPSLARRRAYLYGTPEFKFGRTIYMGGIEQKRGPEAVKRLEATMMALWRRRTADAKAAVMNREPGAPLTSAHQADSDAA